MITIEDCIALSELTEEEVDAIAMHEHLPEIVAVELGSYLVTSKGGKAEIRKMILDDIAEAYATGHTSRVGLLKMALQQFEQDYGALRPTMTKHATKQRHHPMA